MKMNKWLAVTLAAALNLEPHLRRRLRLDPSQRVLVHRILTDARGQLRDAA
jgi:hypothetical protein